ncbi:putative Ubiquitin-like domain-containing protein [Helianthus annuus]|nr:putative Ubiquitin-like domain-containing protein [Helianthus annuus]
MEQQPESKIYQLIAKLLNGKSQTLNFQTPIIPISSIKSQIQTLTSIPPHLQLLISNGKTLTDDSSFHHEISSNSTVHLLLRLRGGKGGFGSLLRGAATKAGQKKTNNFDACRDMSGRRLRHVNAEKKMEEWLAEEKERKLEKVAEEFLKKNAKKVKKAGGGDGAEKYVEKYRKDSEKCREEVEKSVRESLSGGFLSKRKGVEDGESSKSKKLKIWMGKRKVDDSDSDDTDEEDSDDEMDDENEKSAVTNNENQSDSNKELDGSLASVTGGKVEGESSVGCSSESASEEEKETVTERHLGSIKDSNDKVTSHEVVDVSVKHDESIVNNSTDSVPLEEKQCELQSISNGQEAETTDVEATISDSKVLDDKEKVCTKSDCDDILKPLNFDEFNSAAELEVLGMERLKTELQERGLKCGGTLQERAARLYLLKTTPVEKLPKKLLAKK